MLLGMFSALSVFVRPIKGEDTVTAWAGLDAQRDVTTNHSSCLVHSRCSGNPMVCRSQDTVTPWGKGWKFRTFRVSHLQRHGVTVRGNVTSVYPPLEVEM
jgi:hypothetical protein